MNFINYSLFSFIGVEPFETYSICSFSEYPGPPSDSFQDILYFAEDTGRKQNPLFFS